LTLVINTFFYRSLNAYIVTRLYKLASIFQETGPVPTIVDSAVAYSAGAGVYGPACHMG
jgi:hypothetical protein